MIIVNKISLKTYIRFFICSIIDGFNGLQIIFGLFSNENELPFCSTDGCKLITPKVT